MLVLSRKPNETITIDGRITIRVVRLNAGRVRLGIEAPASVQVVRSELLRIVRSELLRKDSPIERKRTPDD